MLNQKLKKMYNFFFSGKKSTFPSGNPGSTNNTQTGKNKNAKIQLLYHRDISNLQAADAKTEPLQHDWWIN
jgi:hypothetical protein